MNASIYLQVDTLSSVDIDLGLEVVLQMCIVIICFDTLHVKLELGN